MTTTWTQETVPTPALVIDAESVRRNIARMASYASAHNLKLRPHIKTHKLRRVAEMQMEAGAVGLTTAKVGEAEVMSELCEDLLIAYPPVDAHRAAEIGKLARKTRTTVGLDSLLAAERLSVAASNSGSEIGILIDLDVGFGRTGVQGAEAAAELAKQVDALPGLHVRGLMYFPGNVPAPGPEQSTRLAAVESILRNAVSRFREQRTSTEIVSGGSTPTAFQTHLMPSTTEFRPGTYIYNDRNCIEAGVSTVDDCAGRIIATVISTSVPGQVVLDAGSKTLTSDRNGPNPECGYGLILEYPDAVIGKLSEEHAQVDTSACGTAPELGERVTIIPNHICPCVNLQNQIWWLQGNELTAVTVDARGLLV
ncbi:alanine racemase [Rubinisphaera margarita]|uniref:alanine racemase n=1 Tax=Rubinisphaera margarita TaxID=2909586 RepID=UPI001EE7E13F|nr:alanine racemase [Rubinisphaera margarita]MCG6155594.1 alanine racemase [Rubinisphaera margarita]